MSKLMDRLDRIAKGTNRSLGFAPSGNREPLPSMVLLAWWAGVDQKEIPLLLKAGADALVVPDSAVSKKGTEKQLSSVEGANWGVHMEAYDSSHQETDQNKGCDFVVFGIEGTRVDVLAEGERARVLRVPADMPDSQLRGLEDLPVDIIIVRRPVPESPLSLVHLLAISNVRSATGRYLLLEWDAELTAAELEQLRDIGVDGLVVCAGAAQASIVTVLRERINALPRRKPRGEKPSPILPRATSVGGVRPRREEEEEEEEEEWDEP